MSATVPSEVLSSVMQRWQSLTLAVLLIWPFLATHYATGLITETLIFAIVAISLDLLIGYGGLVSFGHAAFFGLGAYGAVLFAVTLGLNPWIAIIAGVLTATVGATVIGFFCVRMRGVAFLMVTLAFAQLLYSGAVKWRWLTGGSDGIGGLSRPSLLWIDLADPIAMYLFTLAIFVICLYAMRRVISSQFGHALVGVRENEVRMRAIGCPTKTIKLVAFIVAGAFGGVSGALYGLYNGFVSPDSLSWSMSGMFILMVVLGGAGSLVGPAIGAGVFLLMKHLVSSQTQHWLLIVGIIFVFCVMFCRSGIYGLLDNYARRKNYR
jgi:branched-chain amino acid transport system permease protein